LDAFYRDFTAEITKTASSLNNDVIEWKNKHGEDRKLFANNFIRNSNKSDIEKTIYWLLFKGNDALESVLKIISENTSDKKHLQRVKHLAGNIDIRKYKNYDKPKRILDIEDE
jgi:hypothetical protein